MAADKRKKENRERAAKARRPPLKDTRYTDAELNARVRDFPSVSEIWNSNGTSPILLNQKQEIYISAFCLEEDKEMRVGFNFFKMKDRIINPTIVTLSVHLLLRRYKTHVIVKRLKLLNDGDPAKEQLYGWSLSDHEVRRSVDLLDMLYGSRAVKFRGDACEIYYSKFGDWLSRDAASRRGRRSIYSNRELSEQLLQECSIFPILRRALGDAESAASEWPSILSGKHVPTLNRLHRIVDPKQDGVEEMIDCELSATSIIVSFFGCTNAALVYPKLMPLEDAFHVLCFLGHVNLGKIGPTVAEAEAFLRYCDVDRDETMPAAVRKILAAADKLCDWTRYRAALADTCRKTIEAADAGHHYPCRIGRLWPMV